MPPSSIVDTLNIGEADRKRVQMLREKHGNVMRRVALREASREMFGTEWATAKIVKNKAFQYAKGTGLYVLSVLDARDNGMAASRNPDVIGIKERDVALFKSQKQLKEGSFSFEVEPPSSTQRQTHNGGRIVKIDWALLNDSRAEIGVGGEVWILSLLKLELQAAGRPDLASRVEHVSQTTGDGLGYDIVAFDQTGTELFVEVKTTICPDKNTPFYVTNNELAAARTLCDRYWLYRVFLWHNGAGKYWRIQGPLEDKVNLEPTLFMASL